jgi:hypothetical protein
MNLFIRLVPTACLVVLTVLAVRDMNKPCRCCRNRAEAGAKHDRRETAEPAY